MESKSSKVSRRNLLKTAGAAAIAGGASALLGGSALPAQQGAPAVLTNSQAGRRFRAFVKFDKNAPSLVELKARALVDRQILVRVEASQTCYTQVDEILLPTQFAPRTAVVQGHGGVGIVEAVGPKAITCQVGDRVVIAFHAACGRCHDCLWMRSSQCQNRTSIPTSEMTDGTPVYSNTGTMAELCICNEEVAIPVFTRVSPAEMAMLTCVGNSGLGMAMTNCPVELASDVVIFGGGPVGLSSVQGARLKGAARIILVEPIKYRRDLGTKLGATDVLDPNQFTRKPKPRPERGFGRDDDRFDDSLVQRIREMCKPSSDRTWAGGGRVGPDHVLEAVGGDRVKPKEVQGPDPSGMISLQQSWELCSRIGTFVTCSFGHASDLMMSVPAEQFSDGAKHVWAGTDGGTNDRRDVPRFVRLMETGQLNMKALVGKTFPLNQVKQAYQECADRTTISTVVLPT